MDSSEPGEPKPTTIRGYARSRGVSATAVLKAIKTGRLAKSIVVDGNGTPQIADVDLADREWAANTDLSRAPGYVKARAADRAAGIDRGDEDDEPTSAGSMSLAVASALEKEWKAKLAELDYLERTGVLVNAHEIESKLAEAITRCRTRLLGMPSKLKTAIPTLTRADLVTIDAVIREALEELAAMAPGASTTDTQGAA